MPAVTFGDAGTACDRVLSVLLSALLCSVHFVAGLYSSSSSSLVLFKDVESFPPPPSSIRVTTAFGFFLLLFCCCFCCCFWCCLCCLFSSWCSGFFYCCCGWCYCTSSGRSCVGRSCCFGGELSRFWGEGGFIVYCLLFTSFRTTTGAFLIAFDNTFAVVVGCGCVVTFFPGDSFNTYPEDLHDKPSTITSIFFPDPSTQWGSRQSSGGSQLLGEQAMPNLLSTALTSSTCQYLAKKHPSCLHWWPRAPNVHLILVLRVPMYSVWGLSDLDISILLPISLASFSVGRRMSHVSFNLLASTFGPMLKLFRASSFVSLSTPINFRLFTSRLTSINGFQYLMRNSFPLKIPYILSFVFCSALFSTQAVFFTSVGR